MASMGCAEVDTGRGGIGWVRGGEREREREIERERERERESLSVSEPV